MENKKLFKPSTYTYILMGLSLGIRTSSLSSVANVLPGALVLSGALISLDAASITTKSGIKPVNNFISGISVNTDVTTLGFLVFFSLSYSIGLLIRSWLYGSPPKEFRLMLSEEEDNPDYLNAWEDFKFKLKGKLIDLKGDFLNPIFGKSNSKKSKSVKPFRKNLKTLLNEALPDSVSLDNLSAKEIYNLLLAVLSSGPTGNNSSMMRDRYLFVRTTYWSFIIFLYFLIVAAITKLGNPLLKFLLANTQLASKTPLPSQDPVIFLLGMGLLVLWLGAILVMKLVSDLPNWLRKLAIISYFIGVFTGIIAVISYYTDASLGMALAITSILTILMLWILIQVPLIVLRLIEERYVSHLIADVIVHNNLENPSTSCKEE